MLSSAFAGVTYFRCRSLFWFVLAQPQSKAIKHCLAGHARPRPTPSHLSVHASAHWLLASHHHYLHVFYATWSQAAIPLHHSLPSFSAFSSYLFCRVSSGFS